MGSERETPSLEARAKEDRKLESRRERGGGLGEWWEVKGGGMKRTDHELGPEDHTGLLYH